ncbi:TlpA family protein disulfide reductase [Tropicimonas sp. S265A]|uniref:TlpA family protein disulfide reductase n=1 Tax=Tropicimonas sp. S265A TaxID=3415134 RepID=UPI003C79FD3D
MRFLVTAVLYLGLSLGANADTFALETLRDGEMKKLQFHAEPVPASDIPFVTDEDVEKTLEAYEGKIVVLNFWATWCGPCRREMPSLDRLNQAFPEEDFAVVTLATGRNSVHGIKTFFADEGVETLTEYRDSKDMAIAKDMDVPGLPVTVILNREGDEIARLLGDAEWDTPSAKAIVSALLATY